MRNESGKRLRGLALVFMLLLSLILPQALKVPSTAAFAQAENGLVRVLLTRLALTDRLDAALDGSYSLEPGGLSFQRGSKITISSAQGTLMLYYEGMAMNAGQQLVLRRHAVTGEENGLRLNGDYSLYTGDLVVSLRDGMLRAVLHVPMEEYLLGVVPYEMSDSFPLEALKAQAVTARTYALKRTGSTQDYDVVDNTNDQVFKGMLPGNVQAVQAVRETEGVVGFFNGGLAECYYSASNGGQTELIQHVWGSDENGISVIKDDPYDVENPMSIVKSYAVPSSTANTTADDPLMILLKNALSSQLATLGYDSNTNNIHVTAINGITAHTPRFPEPSRIMTMLRFDVRAEARKSVLPSLPEEESFFIAQTQTQTPVPTATPQGPQWTAMQPVPQALTIDIPIFPDVETALNLSINGDNNEIVTVRETEDSFVIESRRYGHGVGLSQRGAEWMALKDNVTFAQILEFYFPGMKLVKMTSQATPLPPIDASFLATPGPPATPTPRPTLMPLTQTPAPGQWKAKVSKIAENSSLNLRGEPSLTGPVVRLLYYGQKLLVLEELPDGWLKVKTDAMEGYVMSSFVVKDE
jgi:SpoIID/LytB domain protein